MTEKWVEIQGNLLRVSGEFELSRLYFNFQAFLQKFEYSFLLIQNCNNNKHHHFTSNEKVYIALLR